MNGDNHRILPAWLKPGRLQQPALDVTAIGGFVSNFFRRRERTFRKRRIRVEQHLLAAVSQRNLDKHARLKGGRYNRERGPAGAERIRRDALLSFRDLSKSAGQRSEIEIDISVIVGEEIDALSAGNQPAAQAKAHLTSGGNPFFALRVD